MDFLQVLKTVAPWIATAIGGPLGGMAVDAAASALGISDKTTEGIKAAISGATPEQLLALKQADNDFSLKMQELNFKSITDLEAIAANDRDSARKREMEVKDNTPRNLAYLITAGFFAAFAFLALGAVPVDSRDIMFSMVGTLGTVWIGITGYYFGTTANSKAKTELLAKSSPVK